MYGVFVLVNSYRPYDMRMLLRIAKTREEAENYIKEYRDKKSLIKNEFTEEAKEGDIVKWKTIY